MTSSNQASALVQINRAEHFLMGFDLLYRFRLHYVVDKKTAVWWASEHMRIFTVELHIDSKLVHVMTWVFLDFYATCCLDETALPKYY
jgi:hypothetical protein